MNEYDDTMIAPLDALESSTGRHPVNITQLVMGVAFAGMLLVWALFAGDVVSSRDFRWLLPIPWLSAGVAGLAATFLHARRGRDADANY